MLVDQGLEILDEAECLELLKCQRVGRIAVSVAALPAIFPVNYLLVDGDVAFLTGDGMKANAAIAGNVVGFEVDQVDSDRHTGWSVLVVGRARIVPEQERRTMGDLHLSPWAGGTRTHLVRIRPEFISGRRISDSPTWSPASA